MADSLNKLVLLTEDARLCVYVTDNGFSILDKTTGLYLAYCLNHAERRRVAEIMLHGLPKQVEVIE